MFREVNPLYLPHPSALSDINRWDTPQHVLTDDTLDTDHPEIWPGELSSLCVLCLSSACMYSVDSLSLGNSACLPLLHSTSRHSFWCVANRSDCSPAKHSQRLVYSLLTGSRPPFLFLTSVSLTLTSSCHDQERIIATLESGTSIPLISQRKTCTTALKSTACPGTWLT